MIWGYGFYSLGELLVSGLGLAMMARYVPARMGGFMMGAYFVASGVSQYLGGVVASYASISGDITNDPVASLPIYTALFNKLGIAALVCTVIAVAVLPLMKRLSATHSSHSLPDAGAGMPTIASEE
jgi:POT family proton-dependent oligopeptide transporter